MKVQTSVHLYLCIETFLWKEDSFVASLRISGHSVLNTDTDTASYHPIQPLRLPLQSTPITVIITW